MTDSPPTLSNAFFRRRAVMVLGVSILLAAFFFAGGLVIGRRSVTAKLREARSPGIAREAQGTANHIAGSSSLESKAGLPSAPTEIYTVRVENAANMDDALAVAEKLHQLSYSRVALVVPPKNSVSQNILVEVGPFVDKKHTDSIVHDLKGQGFPQAEFFAK